MLRPKLSPGKQEEAHMLFQVSTFQQPMFKKWKSTFFSSASYILANDDTQHENLLAPEEQDDTAAEPQHTNQQFPLIVYWIYFTYGIAMLLPWNVSLAVLLWIRQKKNTLKVAIVVPLSVNLLIFSFFALSSLTDPKESAAVSYFWTTIAFMVITGLTTSMIQLTVLAETSQLLPKYMQAVMSGQGIAGVSVALFSLLTTLLFKRQQLDAIATFYYFISALLVTLVAIMGHFALIRQPAYRRLTRDSASTLDTIPMTITMESTASPTNTTTNPGKNGMRDIITKKTPGYIFSIIYIYIITLALFPSITVLIRSVNNVDSATFISLHFLLFNIGDWIGRTLPIFACCQRHALLWSHIVVCHQQWMADESRFHSSTKSSEA
ncbi:solute carrier family 29 (equilibrative nucleoside transporter), member 4 [Mucor ambiguus]|uniref:Solute carrier family 29 (Equilibrative nucleoside transporter), member 4 n=1 Tax=Mucor ambiguus TaxID=91626 RepID=A0A0C9N8B6_9FUNG|nr:solute carrier family 29 (equilibrative nucleoside transporter), member 4 [Mucor ambiguus]